MQKRDYQERDLLEIEKRFEVYDSILYQLATGGGKSHVASNFTSNNVSKGKNVLIVAHRQELISQMTNHCKKKNIGVGMMIGSTETNLEANVIVASVFTVTKENRMNSIIDKNFDVLIVDEAHRTASTTYENIISSLRKKNPKLKLLGLSATPKRRDNKSLAPYYEDMICSEDVKSLIEQGYLADFVVYSMPVEDLEGVKRSGGDYNITELGKYMRDEERIKYVVQSYKDRGDNRQMLVYCVDRKHGRDVTEAYRLAGFSSIEYIDGETPKSDRKQYIEDYDNGKLQILVSIETLTEGVDLPETGCIQLLRPTKSLTLYSQMVGRGLRPKIDGSKLVILDNAGCASEHGLPDAPRNWTLDTSDDVNSKRDGNVIVAVREDGTFETDLDKAEGLELVELTKEEYLKKVLNNLDKAKEWNEEISRKQKSIKDTIWDTMDKLMLEIGLRPSGRNWGGSDSRDYKDENGECFEIKSKEDGFALCPPNQSYHRMDAKTCKKQISICYNFYSNGGVEEAFLEYNAKMACIEVLDEQTLNLSEIKERQEEAEEEILISKIDDHLSKGNCFTISHIGDSTKTRPVNSDCLFNHISYWESQVVTKIIFKKDRLLANNPIVLIGKDGQAVYTTKSAKRDKILDIFKQYNLELELETVEIND